MNVAAKKWFILLTLPAVLWLYFNQAAFWHFHILENGIVVEHAHPFKNNPKPGTPYQSHHHSDFEYSILAQLSQILGILLLLVIAGLFLLKSKHYLYPSYDSITLTSTYGKAIRLRGPPLCI